MRSFYRVDITNTIVEVGGDWDDFALANDGDTTTADRVVGTSLIGSINGDNIRMYILALLQRARLASLPIEADYFCSSPDLLRHARMTLTGQKGGSVLVEHKFVSTNQRLATDHVGAGSFKSDWVRPLKTCLECKRVKSPDGWVPREAWSAHKKQTFFRGYCSDCISKFEVSSSSEHQCS